MHFNEDHVCFRFTCDSLTPQVHTPATHRTMGAKNYATTIKGPKQNKHQNRYKLFNAVARKCNVSAESMQCKHATNKPPNIFLQESDLCYAPLVCNCLTCQKISQASCFILSSSSSTSSFLISSFVASCSSCAANSMIARTSASAADTTFSWGDDLGT